MMRILIVTGIFPPDCGGPASYVPKLAAALTRRGHAVEVICLSDEITHDDAHFDFAVRRIRRGTLWPWRILVTTWKIRQAARRHDLVYVNGLGAEAALGAALAGRRAVHKVVGDYAWERAVGRGWFGGTLEEYQAAPKPARLRFIDAVRTWPLKRAERVIVPSRYLRGIVRGWGVENVAVIPNAVTPGADPAPALPAWPGRTLITVCRLVPWKGVDALIRLLPRLPGTRLVIAGDGAERANLEALAQSAGVAERVLFLGEVPQRQVAGYLKQADAFVLNSTYEGLPHAVLEAIAARVPVIATDAGGTGEVVENDVTGLLVPAGDSAALEAAIERLWSDAALGARLAGGAAGAPRDFDAMVGATEAALRGELSVLSLGSTRGLWEGAQDEDVRRMMRYAEHLERYVILTNSYKRHRLARLELAPHVEAIPTNAFTPLDSLARMLWLGWKALRARRFSLIQAQDPYFTGLAAVVLGRLFRKPVNICVYGPNVFDPHWLASDWRHRVLAPIGRRVLRAAQAIQVDGQMTARSLVAAGLPAERVHLKPMVPANLEEFLAVSREANAVPRLLFVGRLCAQKNLPLMFEALRQVRVPFELVVVGDGPDAAALRSVAPAGATFRGAVPRERIAAEFAAADVFVLSSDYEGYPRVLMEAAAAGLPVVTTAVSGSDEAVKDGVTGFIVPVGDAPALAEKVSILLAQPRLRAAMGAAGRRRMREALDPAANTPAQLAIWKRLVAPPGRRLLLFNLVTDADHPVLGFTTGWIRELAARVEFVEVITMRAGRIDVPANVRVHSAGAERGWSEPRRALEFYRHLFRVLHEGRIDGCFSHMIEVFSVLAGPVLRARGIPLVTWYAHPALHRTLKLAHFFSNRMVTSLPAAYPWRRDKLSVIGQGIDTALFTPGGAPQGDLVLCAGRVSPVKNHATLLRAVASLARPVRVLIVGAEEESCAAGLRALAVELGIEKAVAFAGPVARAELPGFYRRCAVHVNLTPAGFGDKVAWEAMSCGRPCLVANGDFRETLGDCAEALLFRGDDPADLAAKLEAVLEMGDAERAAIGAYLRAQVERLHALPRLAERIVEELFSRHPGRSESGVEESLDCAPRRSASLG